jgi:uncharacterized protein (DUF2062 family)
MTRPKLKEAWRRLRGGEVTPWRAAASVAVGLAIGVTPLWGLHWAIVLVVCVPLRLDAAIAFLASNISLPFVAPFLTLTEIEIGSWARTGHGVALDAQEIRAHGVGAFAAELGIGTAIFAPAIAAVGGAIAYAVVRLTRKTNA